ncbi:MAG: hypothetical protein RLZZ628_2273 [Bacteroidota bacterium]|jgi:hypothetical protein
MKLRTKNLFLSASMLLAGASTAFANEPTPAAPPADSVPKVDMSYKPLILKLDDKGSKYIRFIMMNQVWTSFTENNPGTADINANAIGGNWTSDVAIRRSRILMLAQVNPRFLIMTHFGINNQSFINGGASAGTNLATAGSSGALTATGTVAGLSPSNSGKKPQMFVHEAWASYTVDPAKLHIGAGLHYWNGISRLSSQSTLNMMTLDAPTFNWPNVETTDQFGMQMGIFAKGQLDRLDYRLAINKPFVNGTALSALTSQAAGKEVAANVFNETNAIQGYANWMFWDKESNALPYYTGTYLGTKKVFNIGAGFYSHPEATGANVAGTTTKYNELIIGVDAFLDMPLDKAKGTAINALATYYSMDFGPRYLRNAGTLNEHAGYAPFNGAAAAAATAANAYSWAGAGNLQPTIGTGSIFYGQVGYLLPKLASGHQVMPYGTFTYKNFDRLTALGVGASTQFALGLNYFITGHNAKITAEYSTRPVYKLDPTVAGNILANGSAGQFTIQTHIFL